jgi:hypothetical protein
VGGVGFCLARRRQAETSRPAGPQGPGQSLHGRLLRAAGPVVARACPQQAMLRCRRLEALVVAVHPSHAHAAACLFGYACRRDTPMAETDKWRSCRGKNRRSADQPSQLLPTVDYKLNSMVCARPPSPCVPARTPDTAGAPRSNMSTSGQLAAAPQSNQSAPRALTKPAYRAEPPGRSLKASLHEAVP